MQRQHKVADSPCVLDLLFPPICIACGVLATPGSARPYARLLCARCAAPATALPGEATTVDGIDAVLPYLPPWSTALARLKFSGKIALAGPLGALLATSPRLYRTPQGPPWDAVVPVPLHRLRLWSRGFDQALLLALAATRDPSAPPAWRRALRRTRATRPQSQLPASARTDNVGRAFVARHPRRLAGRRILLLDDVTTTGATLAACCEAVLQAGAAQVGALALLRTLPG